MITPISDHKCSKNWFFILACCYGKKRYHWVSLFLGQNLWSYCYHKYFMTTTVFSLYGGKSGENEYHWKIEGPKWVSKIGEKKKFLSFSQLCSHDLFTTRKRPNHNALVFCIEIFMFSCFWSKILQWIFILQLEKDQTIMLWFFA